MEDIIQLITKYLSLKEEDMSKESFHGFKFDVWGSTELFPSLKGVTYGVPMGVSFFLIFDSDVEGRAVCQKSYLGDNVDVLYDKLEKTGKVSMNYTTFEGGFRIFVPRLGEVLVYKQNEDGRPCITATYTPSYT